MPHGKPARATRRVPKLCRHRSRTGQIRGYVTDPRIGREIYLGVYDSPECGDAYARWRREYLANTSPPISPASSLPVRIDTPRDVADLLEVYLGEARRLYRRVDGRPSTEVMRFQVLTRRVIKLGFGSMPVQTFGRRELLAIRDQMISENLTRRYVISSMARMIRAFRFAESREMISIDQLTRMSALPPLRQTEGKTEQVISGVTPRQLLTIYRRLSSHWQAMVAFHAFTGCRAENAITVRLDELDMTCVPWRYTPSQQKSAWRGKSLTIRVGPRARAALAPYLVDVHSSGYLFPRSIGREVTGIQKRTYQVYHWALTTACAKLKISRITPRQIRHTTASELLRRGVPIHLIGAILGHSSRAVGITGRYASPDERQVCDVVERFG